MSTNESITVSLDWAKKLKEAGWPNEDAAFYWHQKMDGEWEVLTKPELKGVLTMRRVHVYYVAPSAEEILRRLPRTFRIDHRYFKTIRIEQWPKGWCVMYYDEEVGLRYCHAEEDTLANAAASMWCYLADNKLLP